MAANIPADAKLVPDMMGDADVPDSLARDEAGARGPAITVSRPVKLAWGAGGLGAQLALNMTTGVALFYLTTVVGISAAIAGTLITASKLWDAFSDPITGVISDRSTSNKGRRRPFLFWGALLTTVSVVLAFSVPPGDGWLNWTWALVTLILITSGYSLFNVPYMAMPAEMTTDYHERSAIHSYRVVFAIVGTMLASSGTGIILARLGTKRAGGPPVNDPGDYQVLALIYGAIILATMLWTWAGTRSAPMVARTERAVPLGEQAVTILRNRPFMVIICAKGLQLLGIASAGAATFFLVVNVLQRSTASMALIGIPFVLTGFLVTPLLYRLSRRIGKKATLVVTLLFPAVANLSWLLAAPGDPDWTLAARGVLTGVGFSGTMLFAMSMLTDAIEVDSVRSGLRREGTYMAVYSFAEKFAASFGATIVGWALAGAGFSKNAPVTPETYDRVRDATLIGCAYIPAACATSAALLVLFLYRIDHDALDKAARMYERKVAA